MIKYIMGYVNVFILVVTINLFAQPHMQYVIRNVDYSDKENLMALYKRVTALPGGLIRTPSEVTDGYIDDLLKNGINQGLCLVVDCNGLLIGAMTKYKLGPQNFAHVFSGGSILVDPAYQGIGVGTHLITTFLEQIKEQYHDILRVEIVVRESNPAISLYKRLGFIEEGRLEKRSHTKTGSLEADIQMVWFNPNYKHNNE
ncbi:MAG: GNAT family N-acetyltransferase [Candidatus Babeliales bacterium]